MGYKRHVGESMVLKAVSLFSSGGIGDLGIRKAGIRIVCANELLPDRCRLFENNFPNCVMIEGDVHLNISRIIEMSREKLAEDELFLLFATPPCQGMSSNGAGKLLSEVRKGRRPKLDPRNRLVLPTLEIIKALRPRWVVFENVAGMKNTLIDFEGRLTNMLDVIRLSLGSEYEGGAYVVQMADYGVPQRRVRLITVYTRDSNGINILKHGGDLIPAPTHGKNREKWISVMDAIDNFPPLDAKTKETATSKYYLHQVPVLDEDKYFWVINTPLNETAFNNQCINPTCGYQNNPRHGAKLQNGINQAKTDTPLYCIKCGSLLPRPFTRTKNGELRLMKGFVSAYKRMDGRKPAPAITTNFSFPCSDHKIHPTQNRVLSLAEACVLQTISKYEYDWKLIRDNGKEEKAPASLIREVIGESVPPFFIEQLRTYLIRVTNGSIKARTT